MPDQPGQSQPDPASQVQDPSFNYERSHPQRESPAGGLDQKPARTHTHPDVAGPESTSRSTNRPNSDSMENSTRKGPETAPADVKHSMKDEEPTGWDQAPQDIEDPTMKRHPKTDGKGGTA